MCVLLNDEENQDYVPVVVQCPYPYENEILTNLR